MSGDYDDCYGCCLAHHRKVRWLAWPMWWHHVDDLSTCSRLLRCQSPHAWTTNLKLEQVRAPAGQTGDS